MTLFGIFYTKYRMEVRVYFYALNILFWDILSVVTPIFFYKNRYRATEVKLSKGKENR